MYTRGGVLIQLVVILMELISFWWVDLAAGAGEEREREREREREV